MEEEELTNDGSDGVDYDSPSVTNNTLQLYVSTSWSDCFAWYV